MSLFERLRLDWLIHGVAREVRRQRPAAAALAVGFAVAVVLLGAYRLSARTSARVTPVIRDGVHVIAYLRDDVGAARAQSLREALAAIPGVRSARLVTSEEARERLGQDLGADKSLLEGVEDGFLPASIEAALHPTPSLGERSRELAQRLARLDGIAEVDSMQPALERLLSWIDLADTVGFAALVVAGGTVLTLLVLAGSLVRVRRREESRLLAMLGATSAGLRAPAAVAAAGAAIVGGAVGLGLLLVVYRLTLPTASAVLGPLSAAPSFLPPSEWAAALGLAALLGLVVGAASVSGAEVEVQSGG